MTLRIIESFDLYPAVNFNTLVGNPWINQNGPESAVSTLNPRNGRACARFLIVGRRIIRNLNGAPASRIICGAAIRQSAFALSAVDAGLGMSDDVNPGLNVVAVDALGQIGIRFRGAIIASSGVNATLNTYGYYMLDVDTVANTLDLYFNRTKIITGLAFAGLNWALVNAQIGSFASIFTDVDDVFYAVDSDAAERAALTGAADFSVIHSEPSANGLTQQWGFVGGASAFESINNLPYNTAQYIEGAAALDVSQFDYSNSSAGVFQVYGAQHYYYSQKSTAGAGSIQASIEGGAGADNPQAQSFAYEIDNYAINPGTGLAWVPADLASINGQFTRTA